MCDRVYSWIVIVFGFLENPDKKNYLPPLFLLMFIGTTEAGSLLGVSSARVRTLLIQGRIQGAYKISNVWIIPLVNGMPVISPGRAGPRPRWHKPPPRSITCIHINKNLIAQNNRKEPEDRVPVISVKKGSSNVYAWDVEVLGGCRIVYRHDSPKNCGARVWIETYSEVKLIDRQSEIPISLASTLKTSQQVDSLFPDRVQI